MNRFLIVLCSFLLVMANTAYAQQLPITSQFPSPQTNPTIRHPNKNPPPSEPFITQRFTRIPHNRLTVVDGEFTLDSAWQRNDGKKLLVHSEGSLDKKVGLYSVTLHLASESVSFAKSDRVVLNLQKMGVPMLNQSNCNLEGYYAIKMTDFGVVILDEKKIAEQTIKTVSAWIYDRGISQALQKVNGTKEPVQATDILEQNLLGIFESAFQQRLIWENQPLELKTHPSLIVIPPGKNYNG